MSINDALPWLVDEVTALNQVAEGFYAHWLALADSEM